MGYFLYNFVAQTCKTSQQIVDGGGTVVENPNGTVSVYSPNSLPVPLTKPCCERLDSSYTWDANNQECIWGTGGSSGATCPTNLTPFNVVLNPVDDDGATFNVDFDNKETCILDISFDYLFNFDCQTVLNTINNINANLTAEEIKLCEELEIKKEELETLIETNETQLTILNTTLENTPFVIECVDSGIDEPLDPVDPIKLGGGGIDPNEPNDGDDSAGDLPDPFDPSGGSSSSGPTTPPTAFPTLATSTYCLTALGLQSWETILGTVNYNTWFTSEGTNTTVYDCDDVAQLIALDNGTGTLLGTCEVSITERQEIITTITNLQTIIKRDKLTLEGIIKQIDDLCGGVNCNTFKEMLENLNVCMVLQVIDPITNSLITIHEEPLFHIGDGNLYNYLLGASGHTGLFISASTQSQSASSAVDCDILGTQLVNDLVKENAPNDSESVTFTQEVKELVTNAFESSWYEFESTITDPNIIAQITNKKIKISLKVKECCVDFCILLDRIKLEKKCTSIDSTSLQINSCPSFDLIRVCDNKKSWLTNEEFKHREFDLKFRDTQYDIHNYKLALNSKEVDLDINPANAIEQDVFCYIQDNPCLLSGTTGATLTGTCGDVNIDLDDILTTDIDTLTSLKEFKDVISSELIDAKGWSTMTAYPTLRMLYERYMNSTAYCNTTSSAFDYCDMGKFSELVGTYWVDLIEQVIPSTTIWGSTYVYGNTIFDQQKFNYKKYTLLFCDQPPFIDPLPSPTNGCANVNVITTELESEIIDPIPTGTGTTTGTTTPPAGLGPVIGNVSIGRYSGGTPQEAIPCNTVCIKQINCGSEFVGTLTVIGPDAPPTTGSTSGSTTGDTTVNECSIVIDAVNITPLSISGTSDASAQVISFGSFGPVTYLWSNGQTTQTAINLSAGTYTCTVTDTSIQDCDVDVVVIIDPPAIQIGDCINGGFVFYLDGNGGGLVVAEDDVTPATLPWRGHLFNTNPQTTVSTLGFGQSNTTNIIAVMEPRDFDYAAQVANDWVVSGACGDAIIYDDWYLPSIDELTLAHANLNAVGDLQNDYNFQTSPTNNYWSSTHYGSNQAYYMNLLDGNAYTILRSKTNKVRLVRSF